jgi:cytochrome b
MLIDSKHIDTSGLAVSILAVIGVIWVRIEEAETRLREHALRNELAVAKLAELIAARNAVAPKIEPTP